MIERELRFTPEDMLRFAQASGDFSPLHTDPAFARRTAFGGCIVYGGLLSIGLLGLLPDEILSAVRSIRSSFPGPVLPGTRVTARAQTRGGRAGQWEARLTGRGKVLARLVASTGEDPPAALDRDAILQRASAREETIVDQHQPTEAIVGAYHPGPQLEELADRLGVAALDRALLEGIAWASHLVGMSLPDFDGLCAAVTIAAGSSTRAAARQWVRVRDHDERSDRLLLEGVLSDEMGEPRCVGLIECFPFAPTPLPASAALTGAAPLPAPHGTVVIIGGSRGLGAQLALSMLARGYVVHVIYSASTDAARHLSRLAGDHAPRLQLHQLDAGDPASLSRLADSIAAPIDGLALCAAPPPLAMSLTVDSAGELGEYVTSSLALVATPLAALLPLLARAGGWVLFCSAASLADPPRDLPQFIAAKAALEGLARWVASTTPCARVLVARSPRMRTDLVNTPSARAAAATPQSVVASLLERLDADDPAGGLSIVEPDPVGAALT